MQGTVFDIKRYAIHDGPGIRTTVFMKGCALRCPWCHNPESQSAGRSVMNTVRTLDGEKYTLAETVGYRMEAGELAETLLRDAVFFDESGGGATFSGGEPLAQAEFLLECLTLCKQNGLHTCVDTSGAVRTELLKAICAQTDLFLYDLKTVDGAKFKKYIGNDMGVVLDNLKTIVEEGVEALIRIPCIPGFNMTEEEFADMAGFLETLPPVRRVELLPFHHTGRDKYARLGKEYTMNDTPVPAEEEMERFREIFRKRGFNVK